VPEKFSFCPKNNGFARVWGLQPPAPGSYAYEANSIKVQTSGSY